MSRWFWAAALVVCLSAGSNAAAGQTAIPNSIPLSAPIPAQTLTPSVAKYKAVVQTGGQTMSLAITSEIKDQGNLWAATESTETPIGEATDTVLMDKRTLILSERHIRQGPLTIDLKFSKNMATGTITLAKSGESKTVNSDLGGPLFADSAGALQSLAALPLADGYKAAFRNFDLQTQKPKELQLAVTGSETVTVPAGTFDAWKLEITPVDDPSEKRIIWIAKAQRKCVKYTVTSSQGGGTNIAVELQP